MSLLVQTVKESACNAGDPGSIPGSGRSPGEGNATHSKVLPREFDGQKSLGVTVHGVVKSWTWLRDSIADSNIYIYMYVHIYTHIYTIGKLFTSITGKDEKYLTIKNVINKFSDTPSKNVK